jgi:hypothetical protein
MTDTNRPSNERATFIELLNLAEHFLAERQPESEENALRKRIADALTQAPAVETSDEITLTRAKLERLQRWAAKAGHFPECAHWKPWTCKGCTCGLVDHMMGRSSSDETTAPRVLKRGDAVTYSPAYATRLPREGWTIETLPNPVYGIKHPNGSLIAVAPEEIRAVEPTPDVPLTELQECLASEGAKDYRIEALEAALDWALPAVFHNYSDGEAPKVPGAYEEIEKGRARVIAELDRLQAAQSSENGSETTTEKTHGR